MTKIAYVDYDGRTIKNRCFEQNGRDNTNYTMILLRDRLKEIGCEFATYDIISIEEADIVIYAHIPKILPKNSDIAKSYAILWESPMISPRNWKTNNHNRFNKIFTWHDEFAGKTVNGVKYIKLNYPFKRPETINKNFSEKTKLVTLVAGHKKSRYSKELYSKRIDVIRWFEKYHPDSFEFYGVGWDRYVSKYRYVNTILRMTKFDRIINIAYKFFKFDYPSYKGPIDSKIETMSKYKFAVCYENCGDMPGYITEKIFDCFLAGCVPIYGAGGGGCKNNIYSYIPKECFIDIDNFANYEEMYSYISDMNDNLYMQYLNAIEKYITSKSSDIFTSEYVVDTIVREII